MTITNAVVEPGSRVSLHFSLSLEGGDVIDSTFESQPATLVIGSGVLPAGFEKYILGMTVGTRKVFHVQPEDGFGQHNTSNIQVVDRSRFAPDMELAEGLVISFADPSGGEMPGVVSQFDDHSVTIDFNHPLAGKNLDFEVEVLSVIQP